MILIEAYSRYLEKLSVIPVGALCSVHPGGSGDTPTDTWVDLSFDVVDCITAIRASNL